MNMRKTKNADTTMVSQRAALSNEALAKYLPVFAVLTLGGLFAIAFLPLWWREPGDSPANPAVTAAYFVGAGVAVVVLGLSLFLPRMMLKYVSVLAITLVAVMFFTLSSAFYYHPGKMWPVGVAAMVLVASGTVLYERKWVLTSVLLGLAAFLIPTILLADEARGGDLHRFPFRVDGKGGAVCGAGQTHRPVEQDRCGECVCGDIRAGR
jgi:hypothetical protein